MSFCRQHSQRLLVNKGSRFMLLIFFRQRYPLPSGARPVLPMGVAPEAIDEIFRV
jgi:hypothetical protein